MPKAGRKRGSTPAEGKEAFLRHLNLGLSVTDALTAIDRGRTTYERWRREDKEFVAAVERIRTMRSMAAPESSAESGVRGRSQARALRPRARSMQNLRRT